MPQIVTFRQTIDYTSILCFLEVAIRCQIKYQLLPLTADMRFNQKLSEYMEYIYIMILYTYIYWTTHFSLVLDSTSQLRGIDTLDNNLSHRAHPKLQGSRPHFFNEASMTRRKSSGSSAATCGDLQWGIHRKMGDNSQVNL